MSKDTQDTLFGPADETWTLYEIVMTDDQLAEREEWVQALMDSQDYPSDDQFELELDWWESNR